MIESGVLTDWRNEWPNNCYGSIYVSSAVSVSSGCSGFIDGVPTKKRQKEKLLLLTTIPVSVIHVVLVKGSSVWKCLRVNVLPTCISDLNYPYNSAWHSPRRDTKIFACLTDVGTFLASCPRGPLAVSDKVLTFCCMNVLNIYNQRQMVLRVSVLYIDPNTLND